MKGARGVIKLIDFVSDSDHLAIILEYGGSSLQRYFELNGPFEKKQRLFLQLFRQAFISFKDVHQYGFIHRDIKPANMLVNISHDEKEATLKVIDFGMVSRYKKHNGSIYTDPQIHPLQFLGTPPYAPIAAHKSMAQTPRDDIESLCYTFIYVCIGHLPWKGQPFNSETDRYKHMQHMKERCVNDLQTIRNDLCQNRVPDIICEILNDTRTIPQLITDQWYDQIIKKLDIAI